MAENRFDQLIDHWEPILRKAFLDAIQNIRDGARLGQIEQMIENGDIEGAVKAVGLNPASFRAFDRAIGAAFEAGGVATAHLAPVRLQFQFNIRYPSAEGWLRRYSGDLIREIYEDQKQMIRDVLVRGMQEGRNPRSVALDLVGRVGANGRRQGGLIGLTASQEKWVADYRETLLSDPIKAITRKLRDKRFDKLIANSDGQDKPLLMEQIEKIVAAYRNRALRYRAERIARTEAMAALHQAQQEAITQMLGTGDIQADQISFIWRTARDKRVRDTHRSMDGQRREYGHSFLTGAGVRLRWPGDDSAPPAEVINCRCWREPKIDFLAGIR